jgi:hypothetical protein
MPNPAPGPGDDNPFPLPHIPGNPKNLDCSSQECADAQAAVVNAANDILTTCGQIKDASDRASALLGIAAGIFGLGVSVIGGLATAIGIAATAAYSWQP